MDEAIHLVQPNKVMSRPSVRCTGLCEEQLRDLTVIAKIQCFHSAFHTNLRPFNQTKSFDSNSDSVVAKPIATVDLTRFHFAEDTRDLVERKNGGESWINIIRLASDFLIDVRLTQTDSIPVRGSTRVLCIVQHEVLYDEEAIQTQIPVDQLFSIVHGLPLSVLAGYLTRGDRPPNLRAQTHHELRTQCHHLQGAR